MADVPVSNLFIFSNNVKYIKSSVRMGTAVKVMMRLGDDARLHGIMVKVLQFLEEDRTAVQLDGVIAMLPELIVPVVGTATAIIAEHVHEPFPAAFMQVGVHSLDYGTGREALEVAHHKVEHIFLCAADEVEVIGHDDVCIQFQRFVLLAIADAIIKDAPPARGCASCVLMADVLVSNLFIFSNNVKYVKSSVRMGTAVKVMMRLGDDARLHGIMVKVLQFLEEDPQSRLPAHGRGGHGVKIRLLDFGTVDGSE